jgi:hypothetical protein
MEAFLLLLLGGSALWCVFFDPTHPMLHDTPLRATVGTTVLSAIFLAPGLVGFLFLRRCRWVASGAGVDVYVGRTVRTRIPWTQVIDVEVRPFGIMCWYRPDSGRKRLERMYWAIPGDGGKLRDMWHRSVGRA